MSDTEYLEEQIARLSNRITELENTIYRMQDDIRGIRYTAEDAESKAREAKDTADRAQRGW